MKSPMVYLREWGSRASEPQNQYHPTPEHARLRLRLVKEEAKEVQEELLKFIAQQGDRPALAKELADLVYVTYGTAAGFGIDLDEAIKRVHESNMTKDFSKSSGSGKVMKGPNYVEPYMDDFGPLDVTHAE